MSSSLKYRKEIDGLRAISVIAVVIFHAEISIAGVSLLPGGFLGVDVFFVISGYLISRILFGELQETKTLDFFRFYRRRARRLLPMLFAVIIATIPIAYVVMLPLKLVSFSKSILAALTFVANFFFYASTTSYAATDSNLMPLLNTWSLGIEEQFYLIIPLLLLALHRAGVRRFQALFILLSFLSFALALYLSVEDPSLNFYFPLTRVWELLAGALIAERELASRTQRSHALLSTMGLSLIVFSMCFFDTSAVAHPGPLTLVPVAGTALVLRYARANALARVLSLRLLVLLGLISYSLYLWHFPLFAFFRLISNDAQNLDKILWIVLATFLSAASWKFIETPFRHSKRRLDIVFGIFLLTFIVAFCVLSIQTKGFDSRVPEFLRGSSRTEQLEQSGERCQGNAALQCIFPLDPNQSKSVVLVGDSYADSLAGDLKQQLRRLRVKEFVHMARDGCPMVVGFENKKRDCTLQMQEQRLQMVNEGTPKVVIYAGLLENAWSARYEGKGRAEDFGQKLRRTLERIAEHNSLILVYPIPDVGVHVPQFFNARIEKTSAWKVDEVLRGYPLTTSVERFEDRSRKTFEIYDSIRASHVYRVYPHRLFCDSLQKGRCVVNNSESVFYEDKIHPSRRGAKMINEEILITLTKVLAN